ncbi:MAG: hypothetical protein JSW65_02625 [Candidatus Bipolaricaulota bacterium]|nr:MAG: hypothetical protein JSW65_02625 [Candidatus Bipolaricaulota bacterium]
MKRGVGIAVICLGFAAWAASGADLALCDYHAPQTDLLDSNLSFSYRYYDDPETDGIDVNSGWVKLNYHRFADAPEVGYSLSGLVQLMLADFVPTGGTGSASATMRYYLSEVQPLFAFGGLESSAATGQRNPGLEVRAGVGYGRFSDVTPLAKAFRFQSELIDVGALERELSADALLAIAAEVGKRIEYDKLEDLVGVIESLIENDSGVILNARSLLLIEGILLEQGDERHCGWAVQAGLGYEVVDAFGEPRNVLLTASADAAIAGDLGSQWVLRCSASGPLDILRQHTLTATASGEMTLSEDASFLSDFSYQRVKPSSGDAANSFSAALALSFDIGGADVAVQLSLTRDAGASGWAKDLTISASMDLLQERRPTRGWESGSFELD